jgi:hypothetical protein
MIQIHQTDLGYNTVLSEAPPDNTWLEVAQDLDNLATYGSVSHRYTVRSPYITSLTQDESLCKMGIPCSLGLCPHTHMLYLSLFLAAEAGEI